jgi:hypothetical protein
MWVRERETHGQIVHTELTTCPAFHTKVLLENLLKQGTRFPAEAL